MKTIPDRIFLQWFGDENDPDPNDDILVSEVSWNLERVFDADLEYIRANALPDTEARIAEAVELLRWAIEASDLNISSPTERGERPWVYTARAFLDKVKA